MFYFKMASRNFKQSLSQFAPFLITTITMFVFLSMIFLLLSSSFVRSAGSSTGVALSLAAIVLILFAFIMVLYSYNFLLKQRTKEFGLYNILGMNKKQILNLATIELFYSYFITLILGSIISSILTRLVYLIFVNIIESSQFHFKINNLAFLITSVILFCIYILLEFLTILKIRKTSALNLYKNQKKGERAPKGNAFLALIGIVSILIGYYLSLTAKSQILVNIFIFFIAIVLVIIGTYLFFISFIAWYLKKCRLNKNYFYQPNHFISISQMIFRMKQNAVGLASICLLACMSFVTIFSTSSLYYNTNKSINSYFPKTTNIQINGIKNREEALDIFNKTVQSPLEDLYPNTEHSHSDILNFQSAAFTDFKGNVTINKTTFQSNQYKNNLKSLSKVMLIKFVTASDIKNAGNNIPNLSNNEFAFYTNSKENNLFVNKIQFFGKTYKNVKSLRKLKNIGQPNSSILSGVVIVKDDETLLTFLNTINSQKNIYPSELLYDTFINLSLKDTRTLRRIASLSEEKYDISFENKEESRKELLSITGSFLFIGFLLGSVFLLGAALIIYYKQLTEGQQDKESYRILQEVGMSLGEVKKTINSQIMLIFFLPLVLAIVHFLFAIPLLRTLLQTLGVSGGNSIYLISALTIFAVMILYFIIYKITSKTYYTLIER